MDTFLIWALALFFYFIPTFAANSNKHKSFEAIFILNLLLGWTVLGWIWALIWANTGNRDDNTPDKTTHVKCPDCAELILKEAKVCKHCGCKLVPQP